jgi:membrane protease YdiL (CAAX protease family)
MKIKRAIGISILAYTSSFIIGLIISSALKVNLENPAIIPANVWIFSIIATIIVTIFFSFWYFKDKKTKPSAREGFKFGLTLILIGSFLDMLIIIPYLFVSGSNTDPIIYYSNPLFWLSLLILVATTTIIGWTKQKKI